MPVFMSVFDPVSGNLCGSTRIPSITDSLFHSSAMFEPLPKPVFIPRVETLVENNTGPLLPAIKDLEEINYMKPNAHLSRATKPALLGTDNRPAGFLNLWTEDEKRSHLSGSKTEVELDVAALMRQVKSEQESRFQPKVKHPALYTPYGQPEIKLELPTYSCPTPTPMISQECRRILREMKEQTKPVELITPDLSSGLWSKKLSDGSTLRGIKGGVTHTHDYNDLGIGHIRLQSEKKGYPYNNFNETVGAMMPDWMLKGDNESSEREETPKEEGFFAHLGRFITGGE